MLFRSPPGLLRHARQAPAGHTANSLRSLRQPMCDVSWFLRSRQSVLSGRFPNRCASPALCAWICYGRLPPYHSGSLRQGFFLLILGSWHPAATPLRSKRFFRVADRPIVAVWVCGVSLRLRLLRTDFPSVAACRRFGWLPPVRFLGFVCLDSQRASLPALPATAPVWLVSLRYASWALCAWIYYGIFLSSFFAAPSNCACRGRARPRPRAFPGPPCA